MKRTVVSLLVLILGATYVSAVELETKLGKKGKVLLEEKFDADSVPKGWAKNTGTIAVKDGALRISEVASEKHAGAFRKALAVQDVAIQFDFKFDHAKMLNIGFDPAKGELKKSGHLFSVVVNPKAFSILEHNDKSNPSSKPKIHATKPTEFKDGQWYTVLLENKGEDVLVQIEGKESISAKAEDFRVRKPGLVFRVSGDDGHGMLIDNVHVWELN